MESYKAMFLINSILIASQKKARDKANGSWQSLIMKKKLRKYPSTCPLHYGVVWLYDGYN